MVDVKFIFGVNFIVSHPKRFFTISSSISIAIRNTHLIKYVRIVHERNKSAKEE